MSVKDTHTKKYRDFTMMFEERAAKILAEIKENEILTFADLAAKVGISESTIRRDIAELDERGKLKKIRGGATGILNPVTTSEYDIPAKLKINMEEKRKIARYAAKTISGDDMVYIDAGTTTLMMIPYIDAPEAVFITNGVEQAKRLANAGYVVHLAGGKYKRTTDATVGHGAVQSISKYNFTKCFMGTNGVDEEHGYTTPDIDEALIKEAAIHRSYIAYVLADHSKFKKVSTVTFSEIGRACIITDKVPYENFKASTVIKEVGEKE